MLAARSVMSRVGLGRNGGRGRGLPWAHVVGAGLATALAGWVVLTGVLNDASPRGHVLLLAAGALAYWEARILAQLLGWVLPALLSGLIVMVLLVSGGDAWSGAPLAPPLGYGNANGALFGVGAAAAAMTAVAAPAGSWRHACWGLACALSLATVATESRAATAGLLLVAGGVCMAVSPGRLHRAVAVSGVLLVASAVTATALVSSPLGRGLGIDRAAVSTLSARRVQLWADAVDLARQHPVAGVGPARFPWRSPVARTDWDTRQAHSEFLQAGAELGLVGLVLLFALVSWVICVTALAQGPAAPIAVAGVVALCTQASVDYVGHFPLVVLAAVALAGAARGMAPAGD